MCVSCFHLNYVVEHTKKDGSRSITLLFHHKSDFCGLFGNGLHRASCNAGSAIDASTYITFSLSIYHAESTDWAYINACATADAGFFINLNCHGVSPWCFALFCNLLAISQAKYLSLALSFCLGLVCHRCLSCCYLIRIGKIIILYG